MYEVDYDPAAGKITSKPHLLSDQIPGRNRSPSLSPDGRYVAWARPEMSDRRASLVLRELSSGDEQSFDPNMGIFGIIWSPDSRRVIFSRRTDEPNTWDVMEFDRGSSKFSTLLKVHPSRNPMSPCFSADGKTLYYVFREWPKPDFQVMAFDLESQKRSSSSPAGLAMGLARWPKPRHTRMDGNPRRSL